MIRRTALIASRVPKRAAENIPKQTISKNWSSEVLGEASNPVRKDSYLYLPLSISLYLLTHTTIILHLNSLECLKQEETLLLEPISPKKGLILSAGYVL